MSTNATDADVQADFDLGRPEDVLALAERFDGEWRNGGFSQLFANWYPADVALVPEGLRLVEAMEIAAVAEAAIAELGGDRSRWRDLGHEALIKWQEPLGARLRDLDNMASAHFDALTAAIVRYERELAKRTGDPFIDDEDE